MMQPRACREPDDAEWSAVAASTTRCLVVLYGRRLRRDARVPVVHSEGGEVTLVLSESDRREVLLPLVSRLMSSCVTVSPFFQPLKITFFLPIGTDTDIPGAMGWFIIGPCFSGC